MQFIICCTLNHHCWKPRTSFARVFRTQKKKPASSGRGQICQIMGLNTGNFSSQCGSFGADYMRRRLSTATRNDIFNPEGVCPECFLTTPNCNQISVAEIIFQSTSNNWPLSMIWSFAGTGNRVYECFVTLIVFTLFLFSPLSFAECKSLTFKTDVILFIYFLLWTSTTIAKQAHHQS